MKNNTHYYTIENNRITATGFYSTDYETKGNVRTSRNSIVDKTLNWIEGKAEYEVGDYLINGKHSKPTEIPNDGLIYSINEASNTITLDLEALKLTKLREINTAYDAETNQLVATYPANEVLSFAKQEAEAKAYLASLDDNDSPFLANLATTRGIPLQLLCEKVLEKNSIFSVVSGQLTGKRQKLEKLIEVATTANELKAIKWGE